MAQVTRTIMINAPIAQVFGILDDPESLALLYYCVCNVSDVTRTEARVGDRFRGTFSMVGIQFDVAFTCTDHIPPLKIRTRFEGGMKGTMGYTLEAQEYSTRVILEVDYELSGGLLGRIANRLLFEQIGAKNAERILENLALIVEAAIPQLKT